MAERGPRHRFELTRLEIGGVVVSATATLFVVFLLGVYAGRGMDAREAANDQRLVRLPVASATDDQGAGDKWTFDETAPERAGRAQQNASAPPREGGASDKQQSDGTVAPHEAAEVARGEKAEPGAAARAAESHETGERHADESAHAAAKETDHAERQAARGANVVTEPTPHARIAVAIVSAAPSPASAGGDWSVQVTATRDPRTAEAMVQRLKAHGWQAYVQRVQRGASTLYRVRVGRFPTLEMRESDGDPAPPRAGRAGGVRRLRLSAWPAAASRSCLRPAGAEAGTEAAMPDCTPAATDFLALAGRGNLVPVFREILADTETPVSAFLKVARGDHGFLLESVQGGEKWARYSFLGTEPAAIFTSRGGHVVLREERRPAREWDVADPLTALKDVLAGYRPVAMPGLPRFFGGAVGYVAYDAVRFFERLPATLPDDLGLPELYFVLPATVLVFDNVAQSIKVVVNVDLRDPATDPRAAYDAAVARIDEIVGRLGNALCFPEAVPAIDEPLPMRANVTRRGVRRDGRARQGVHPRRRRHPGGAGAALADAAAGRAVRRVPRAAHGEPVAVHVLPPARRADPGRRLARGDGARRGRRDHGAADRRHLAARHRRDRGRRRSSASCSPTRRRSPSTSCCSTSAGTTSAGSRRSAASRSRSGSRSSATRT